MPNDDPTELAPGDAQTPSPEIVMFFLGPDGEAVTEPEATPPRSLGELYRAWRSALDVEREHEDYHRHRPERRVQGTGRPGKHGYRDEIVVTLRSRPIDAVTEALRGELFAPAVRWLRVEPGSLETNRYELTWRAEIRVGPFRSRPAKLRLYASPSLNVTVLSLFPVTPRSVAKPQFLRRGLRVMNELRDRIDERVAASAAAHESPAMSTR